MNKKIIIVGPAFPYRGGQALVESYLFKTLTQLGYDCSTVSFTLLYPSVFFPGTTQFEESSFIAFPHQEKIKRIINSINPFTWIKAARHIIKEKPDAVIFVWWMPFFGPAYWAIMKLMRLFIKTKIVFLMENFVSHEKRFFDQTSASLTLKNADAFICQSSFVKGKISEQYPQKPVYETTLSIFDFFNRNLFTKESARKQLNIHTQKVILFFGLIREYKGLDKLLEAFAIIKKNHAGITLLIVGESYDSFDKYENIIRQKGIGNDIQLHLKYIANENVEPYFKAADVVCLPYNSATQSGIVMMAYGFRRPVVVTDVGGLKELIEEEKTGIVIPNNNPETISEGINQIFRLQPNVDFNSNIDNYVKDLGYVNFKNIFEDILR